MARIKTYPIDLVPTLTDKVVGSDVDESSATKNYTVGSILSLEGSTTYVPYTGALEDVDLGSYSLTLTDLHLSGSLYDNVGGTGSLNDVLSITANGVEWSDIGLGSFVPYTGATDNVDLGVNGLTLTDLTIEGSLTDVFGFTGTSGQLLSSTGTGVQWINDVGPTEYVPYAGAIMNVNLGGFGLRTWDLRVSGVFYDSLGLGGTAGQILSSTGTNVEWINNSGGGGAVDSVNGFTGIVVLDTDDINEGVTNFYYTDARVAANAAVVLNTAKVTNATHTGDVTGDTVLTIAAGAVDLSMLSAGGTPSISTFLRGDNSWSSVGFTDLSGTLTSAQLRSVITDETGSGSLVFGTSPTLTTPNLGTPSVAVLTNATGLVATTGLTATGTKDSTTFLRGDNTWAVPAVAESTHLQVKNTSGSLIAKGTPVYITGNVGGTDKLEIAPADASSASTMPAVGLLESDLENNEEGFVVQGGFLKGLVTATIDGTSTSSNDTVYVKSGGGLTMTKPTGASNFIQNIAKVARVHASNGSLVVSSILRANDVPNIIQDQLWLGNSSGVATPTDHTVENISNVTVSSKTDGQALVWDAANNYWKNGTVSGGGTARAFVIVQGGRVAYSGTGERINSLSSGGFDGNWNFTVGSTNAQFQGLILPVNCTLIGARMVMKPYSGTSTQVDINIKRKSGITFNANTSTIDTIATITTTPSSTTRDYPVNFGVLSQDYDAGDVITVSFTPAVSSTSSVTFTISYFFEER